MVDTARILTAPDVATLRDAVAKAFEELSLEKSNTLLIEALDMRVKTLEETP